MSELRDDLPTMSRDVGPMLTEGNSRAHRAVPTLADVRLRTPLRRDPMSTWAL